MKDKEIGIVLISHGNFAFEALKSAEMIMGHQERVKTIAVIPGMGLDETVKKIDEAFKEVKQGIGVVIMTDIVGGTPSNAAGIFTASTENTLVITGLNMPMLLEILISRNESLDEISKKICNIGKESFINITDKMRNSLK